MHGRFRIKILFLGWIILLIYVYFKQASDFAASIKVLRSTDHDKEYKIFKEKSHMKYLEQGNKSETRKSNQSVDIHIVPQKFHNNEKSVSKLITNTDKTDTTGAIVVSQLSKTKQINKPVLPMTLKGNYLLNNPNLCSGTDRLVALVMVHTAPCHFERRQNIRSTYGSRDLFQNKVRVLFLLGTVENNILHDAIIQEHKKYKDTIQGNFTDSYHNLTHKGVMGFRWITEHCSHVKYVVKVDDDAIFDMWRFLNFFERKNGGKSIFCHVIYRPKISRKGKWKVDDSEFKGVSRWSWNYCPGFVVIFTSDVIAPLFKAAHTTPFLWIDDVYLYGLLPYKAGNMRLYQMPKKLKLTPYEDGGECLKKKGKDCDYLAVGIGYKESNFRVFWDLIKRRN